MITEIHEHKYKEPLAALTASNIDTLGTDHSVPSLLCPETSQEALTQAALTWAVSVIKKVLIFEICLMLYF